MLLLKWKVIPTGKSFRKNEFSGMTCTNETFVLQSFILENERKICFLKEFFSWISLKLIFQENTISKWRVLNKFLTENFRFTLNTKISIRFFLFLFFFSPLMYNHTTSSQPYYKYLQNYMLSMPSQQKQLN